MNFILYVLMFVFILSMSITTFIKEGSSYIAMSPYYTSYFKSSHKLHYQTAKKKFNQLNKKSPIKKGSGGRRYPRRSVLKDSSRFNLATLFDERPESLATVTKIFKKLYQGFPFDEDQFETSLAAFLKDLKKAGLLCKIENKPLEFKELQMKLQKPHQTILYHLLRGLITKEKIILPLESYMRLKKNEKALCFQHAKPEFLEAILSKEIALLILKKEEEIKALGLPPLGREGLQELLERSGKSSSAISDILDYFEFKLPEKDYTVIQLKEEKHGIMIQSLVERALKPEKQSRI